jgi:hypothetical protein
MRRMRRVPNDFGVGGAIAEVVERKLRLFHSIHSETALEATYADVAKR